MLFNHLDKSKQSQRGSIMLEVIAVLALMGVMGAMLFRQIYQRNQELHNIQMASEMRTIKEAFSAYIQAERAELITGCGVTLADNLPHPCAQTSAFLAGDDTQGIRSYLPSGWFMGNTLGNYYTFSLWIYKQNDITKKTILYGVIVPRSETIPQTGWNFKRAARVALLIGADGGVYDENMDSDNVNGALGTWQIDVHSPSDRTKLGLPATGSNYYPTYVAMTGMDIFTPEYELPEGNVNLKKEWDLATRKLGAWNYFSAGGTQGPGGCYVINHEEVDGTNKVKDDNFNLLSATCQPLFFVQNEGGKQQVFVNHDLEVGKIDGGNATPNVTITQEGMIKQENTKGMTIDADGRIITNKELKASASNGEIFQNERYVLDPAYTSTMNDIRLASRGGVRLSDILPRYILKSTQDVSCTINKGNKTCTTTSPITQLTDCPIGYTVSYLITPTQYAVTATEEKPKTNSYVLKNSDSSLKTTNITGVKDGAGGLEKDTTISVIEADNVGLEQIEASETFVQALSENTLSVTVESDKKVKFTYTNNIAHQQTMEARVDGYCVYNVVSGSVKTNERYQTEQNCCEAGLTWQSSAKIGTETGRCVNIYPTCSVINSGINSSENCSARTITNKAAVCKAAGCTWNGTTCS